MFEKAKKLVHRARCKMNTAHPAVMTAVGSTAAMVLCGPSYAVKLPNVDEGGVSGDKNLEDLVTDAATGFLSTFMKWATIAAIVVFVLALLISIVSTDEKKIQQWRNIAKGVVVVWIIIMIAVPLFNWIYGKVSGTGATGGGGTTPTTDNIPANAG